MSSLSDTFKKIISLTIIINFIITPSVYSYQTAPKTTLRGNMSFDKGLEANSNERFDGIAFDLVAQEYGATGEIELEDAVDKIRNMKQIRILISGDNKDRYADTKEKIDNVIEHIKSKMLTAFYIGDELVVGVTDTKLTLEEMGKLTEENQLQDPSRRRFFKSLLGGVVTLASINLANLLFSCSDEPAGPKEDAMTYDFSENPTLKQVFLEGRKWVNNNFNISEIQSRTIRSFDDDQGIYLASDLGRLMTTYGAMAKWFSEYHYIAYDASAALELYLGNSGLMEHNMDDRGSPWTSRDTPKMLNPKNIELEDQFMLGRGLLDVYNNGVNNDALKIAKIMADGGKELSANDFSNVVINITEFMALLKEKGLVDKDNKVVKMDYTNVTLPGYEKEQAEIFKILASYHQVLDTYWNNKGYFEGGIKDGQRVQSPPSITANARAGMFYFKLWKATNNDAHKDKFLKIAKWLKNDMWIGDHFNEEKADSQVVPVLFFDMIFKDGYAEFNPMSFNSLNWLNNNCKQKVTFKTKDGATREVTLYKNKLGTNSIMPGVSLNIAVAAKIWGDTTTYDNILGETTKIQYKDGGMPYSLKQDSENLSFPEHYPYASTESVLSFMAAWQLGPEYFAMVEQEKDNRSTVSLEAVAAVTVLTNKILKEGNEASSYVLDGKVLTNEDIGFVTTLNDLGWLKEEATKSSGDVYNIALNKEKINTVMFSGEYAENEPYEFLQQVGEVLGKKKTPVILATSDEQAENLKNDARLKGMIESQEIFIVRTEPEEADALLKLGDGISIDISQISVNALIENKKLVMSYYAQLQA